jgi:hypothetical protein
LFNTTWFSIHQKKNAYVSANKGFINAKLGTNFSDFEVVEEELDTDAYSKD